MGIEEIKAGDLWRLANIPSRPPVVVQSIDKYSETVYWHYENEKQINESTVEYFLKTFKRVL